MNILEKEKRLKDLLEHNIKNERIGTVIAITGSWGIGKTFFWKNCIEKCNFKKKYVYVSLFGLESLSDLKTHIYSNIENNHSTLEIPRWIRGLPSILKDTKVSHLGLSASTKIFDSLMFNQVKDAIICFDDFERMSNKLDIKDVMGLANYLKLEKNCQVILILDEDKAEGDNKQKYANYKEKLVDEIIIINSVEPLIRENAKGIEEPLVELMIKFAEALEIHNFRFFQKVIKLYRDFIKQLPEVVAHSTKEIILIRILQGYLIHDFRQLDYGWEDCQYFIEKKRENWSDTKKKTYKNLSEISNFFIHSDVWLVEFKKWFEQRDNINFNELSGLANSELISEENQNIRNKLWKIFEKRHDLKLEQQDLEYIASCGKKCAIVESFSNTAFMYEILCKYLPDDVKAEKFKTEIIDYIDSDPSRSIVRVNKERQLWGDRNNIFYTYIDDLAKNYVEEKSLKNIASHFLRYGNFESESDKDQLRSFTADKWFKYLTEEIYQESFFLEQNETLIQYLRQLYSIEMKDNFIHSMVVSVLQKIGEESEFKKRYMNDIIENHLLKKS